MPAMTDRRLPTFAASADARPPGGRGAKGRVAAVQAQTQRGLVVAAGFIVAAVVIGITRHHSGWWLPLHLFVVGGVLSAVAATTQMLAVTWSASPAPRTAVAVWQRWCLALGAVGLVVGRERDVRWLFVVGGVAVITAIVTLIPILSHVRSRAVTNRFAPAIEAYIAAIVAGAVGMSLGIVLGIGSAGTRIVEIRGTHLILNLLGLVGLVIAGTLPYFSATQVRAKMSRHATPTTMRATLLVLAAGVVVAASGRIFDRAAVAAAGLVGYAAGLVAIAAMLPVYGRRQLRWAGPRALQLLTGLAWWAAMSVAWAIALVQDGGDQAILQALVIGGYAQILVASLAYLGPVLRGGGHQHLTGGFAVTRSWLSLIAGNVAATGALTGHGRTVAVALVVWAADFAIRATLLLTERTRTRHV